MDEGGRLFGANHPNVLIAFFNGGAGDLAGRSTVAAELARCASEIPTLGEWASVQESEPSSQTTNAVNDILNLIHEVSRGADDNTMTRALVSLGGAYCVRRITKLERSGPTVAARQLLARVEFANDRWREAKAELVQSLKNIEISSAPEDELIARTTLAQIYLAEEEIAAAALVLEPLSEIDVSASGALFLEVIDSLVHRGDFDAAISQCGRLLSATLSQESMYSANAWVLVARLNSWLDDSGRDLAMEPWCDVYCGLYSLMLELLDRVPAE